MPGRKITYMAGKHTKIPWSVGHWFRIYMLTPRSRVLLDYLTGFQLVKEYPEFYGTWSLITAVPSATHWPFRNMMLVYGEELLATRPTPKLEDHLLSAVRDCLFNTFAASLHIGSRSSFATWGRPIPLNRNPLITVF